MTTIYVLVALGAFAWSRRKGASRVLAALAWPGLAARWAWNIPDRAELRRAREAEMKLLMKEGMPEIREMFPKLPTVIRYGTTFYVKAWIDGGCIFCGKDEREGRSYAHTSCWKESPKEASFNVDGIIEEYQSV